MLPVYAVVFISSCYDALEITVVAITISQLLAPAMSVITKLLPGQYLHLVDNSPVLTASSAYTVETAAETGRAAGGQTSKKPAVYDDIYLRAVEGVLFTSVYSRASPLLGHVFIIDTSHR